MTDFDKDSVPLYAVSSKLIIALVRSFVTDLLKIYGNGSTHADA